MMINSVENEPWDQAVDKLIQLTEENRVQWREARLPLRPLMQEFVGQQYVADIEGRHVAVYEYAFPTSSDEFGNYVDSSIRIEFVDERGEPIWVWPVSKGRRQLLDAVCYQFVHGNQFLDSFLAGTSAR